MSAHENLETAEHAEHAAHANKKIALLISVLALFLAFSETLGKSAQTKAINLQHRYRHLGISFRPRRSADRRAHGRRQRSPRNRPASPTEAKAAMTKRSKPGKKPSRVTTTNRKK